MSWKESKPYGPLGDTMTLGERCTWRVMKIYRRWTVFFLLQILTVLWWVFPEYFPGGLFGWNLVWSDLAVVVEMMVGIAFLNQMFRDGKVIREELIELRAERELLVKIAEKLGVE